MEQKERIEEAALDYKRKYKEDMAEVKADLEAVQRIVKMFIKVSSEMEDQEELVSCMGIIEQSLNGVMGALDRRMRDGLDETK